MATTETNAVPAELVAEMEEAARHAFTTARDPEAMRQACERMDRLREENRRRFGLQNIAVDLIREARAGE